MSDIPYKWHKVADISQVADSEKVAGAVFFDDATETVHIYGAGGVLKIYGSRKWMWSGLDYSTFVKEVAVGDVVIWITSEHLLVVRKDVTLANTAKVTLMADKGFNTLTFATSNGGSTWDLTSSILEDFTDFIATTEASVNPTANSVVRRDATGNVWVHGLVDDANNTYALPYSSEEAKANADGTLQMEITDINTIRNNANTAAEAIPNLEGDIEQLQGVTSDIATIRSNAAKGATAVQKSGDTMTGPLAVPTVIGDLEGTSDFAKDLTGRIEATPEEFTFRPSAGDKSIRDESAVIRSIKGNSVVWNQKLKHTDFSAEYWNFWDKNEGSYVEGNVATVVTDKNGTQGNYIRTSYGKFTLTLNHIYAYCAQARSIDGNTQILWGWNSFSSGNIVVLNQSDDWTDISFISPKAENTTVPVIFWVNPDILSSYGNAAQIKDVWIADLTQMFGAGNEPTTVEEFYERLPVGVDLNAYNEGEIIDGNYEAIETVGFNQWDEQWENGYIDASGNPVDNTGNIRSSNFIPVIGGATYYAKGIDCVIACYDKNKKFIVYNGETGSVVYNNCINAFNSTFVLPINTRYIKFWMAKNYGSTYNNDICINLSHTGYRNGEYEPYKEHTYDLSWIKKYFPNGMRSTGSAHDEVRFNSVTQKWEAVQKIASVELGSLTWVKGPSKSEENHNKLSKETFPDAAKIATSATVANLTCNIYTPDSSDNIYLCVPYKIGFRADPIRPDIVISDYEWNNDDFEDFKQSLIDRGAILYYELAEPIVTPITEPIQLDYWVEDFGTEKLISTGSSTPLKADIIYQFNATDRIRDNYHNIALLSKSKLDHPNGTAAQFIKGDGSLDSKNYADVYTLTARNGSLNTEQFNKLMTSKVVRMTANASEGGNSNLEIQAVNKVFNASTAVMSSMYYNGSQFKMAIINFTKTGTTWSYTTTFQNLSIAPAVTSVSEE